MVQCFYFKRGAPILLSTCALKFYGVLRTRSIHIPCYAAWCWNNTLSWILGCVFLLEILGLLPVTNLQWTKRSLGIGNRKGTNFAFSLMSHYSSALLPTMCQLKEFGSFNDHWPNSFGKTKVIYQAARSSAQRTELTALKAMLFMWHP